VPETLIESWNYSVGVVGVVVVQRTIVDVVEVVAIVD